MHAGIAGKAFEFLFQYRLVFESLQVRKCMPGGDDAQAMAGGGQALEQRGDALILEFAWPGRGGWVLQWFEAVEDEEVAPLAHEVGEALSFFPRTGIARSELDRKSTRLNSSHLGIS